MLGLAAMAGSQAAMVGVMTMTPPHMKDHGHVDLSAFVIALHIAGMYGLSPFVGRFVDRVGKGWWSCSYCAGRGRSSQMA